MKGYARFETVTYSLNTYTVCWYKYNDSTLYFSCLISKFRNINIINVNINSTIILVTVSNLQTIGIAIVKFLFIL